MGMIHTRAAAFLKLLDIYTGQEADIRQIQMFSAQQNKIVKKQEGVAVILYESRTAYLDIHLESNIYQSRDFCIPIEQECPVCHWIWLHPGPGYPFAAGTTFLKGTTQCEDLMLSVKNRELPIRLAVGYTAGDTQIRLNYAGKYVLERTYQIISGEQKEFFRLEGEVQGQKGTYQIKEPCKHSYGKQQTSIVCMVPVQIRQRTFFMGIQGISEKGAVCEVYEKERYIKDIYLEYGKENLIQV